MKSSYNEDEEEQQLSYAMKLTSLVALPMAMQAVVELDVLDIIAKAGPGAYLSASDIASQMATQNPEAPAILNRMLRLLASHSVLSCTVQTNIDGGCAQWLYGLTPVAKYFVDNQDGVSLRPFMPMLQNKVLMDSWYGLNASILHGGIPFNEVHGTDIFDYANKDLRFNEILNKAMINQTTILIHKILQSYKGFEQLKQVVDVGGGLGVTLNLITTKYPHIKGINFDLPHVIQNTLPYPGVEHVGGDMFESVPKGDAIFMKWILHDWNDDHCLKLLKNCHKALPENGKVIVVEGVIPTTPETLFAAQGICQSDMIMMTFSPGGGNGRNKSFRP